MPSPPGFPGLPALAVDPLPAKDTVNNAAGTVNVPGALKVSLPASKATPPNSPTFPVPIGISNSLNLLLAALTLHVYQIYIRRMARF